MGSREGWHTVASLLEENARLRADGATLRERVRKLPHPIYTVGLPGLFETQCAWCRAKIDGETLPLNRHAAGCLWPEVQASAPKEPTP